MTAYHTPIAKQSNTGTYLPGGVIETRPWKRFLLRGRLLLALYAHTLRRAGNPLRAWRWMRTALEQYRTLNGAALGNKMALVDGKSYWRFGGPGFPGPVAMPNWDNVLRLSCGAALPPRLRTVFFAITKKCPYHCEHCYEWEHLHQPETLSREDIAAIVRHFQDYGATQIVFLGGEPLLRLKDMAAVVKAAKPDTDFWMYTTGFSLTAEKALQLKQAGFTGITLSLDHWQPEAHDHFRHFPGAFQNVVQATRYARQSGLVTALSLCATKEMCTEENLCRYLELARQLGVAFVQFLEPLPVGRFSERDVTLGAAHTELLEAFYLKYNSDPALRSYPIIEYPGALQRRIGCSGSAKLYMYVDSDGYAHRCPFCQEKLVRALEFPVKDIVEIVQAHGCGRFAGVTVPEAGKRVKLGGHLEVTS